VNGQIEVKPVFQAWIAQQVEAGLRAAKTDPGTLDLAEIAKLSLPSLALQIDAAENDIDKAAEAVKATSEAAGSKEPLRPPTVQDSIEAATRAGLAIGTEHARLKALEAARWLDMRIAAWHSDTLSNRIGAKYDREYIDRQTEPPDSTQPATKNKINWRRGLVSISAVAFALGSESVTNFLLVPRLGSSLLTVGVEAAALGVSLSASGTVRAITKRFVSTRGLIRQTDKERNELKRVLKAEPDVPSIVDGLKLGNNSASDDQVSGIWLEAIAVGYKREMRKIRKELALVTQPLDPSVLERDFVPAARSAIAGFGVRINASDPAVPLLTIAKVNEEAVASYQRATELAAAWKTIGQRTTERKFLRTAAATRSAVVCSAVDQLTYKNDLKSFAEWLRRQPKAQQVVQNRDDASLFEDILAWRSVNVEPDDPCLFGSQPFDQIDRGWLDTKVDSLIKEMSGSIQLDTRQQTETPEPTFAR
jgi:hypothetical protein